MTGDQQQNGGLSRPGNGHDDHRGEGFSVAEVQPGNWRQSFPGSPAEGAQASHLEGGVPSFQEEPVQVVPNGKDVLHLEGV